MERPQNIEAQISGRLIKWHVCDGQGVSSGQLIAELADLDPKFLDLGQSSRLLNQRKALIARRIDANKRLDALRNQLENLKSAQRAAVPSASERALQAISRIAQADQSLIAAKQNAVTATLNLKRLEDLHDKGLRSRRDLELAQFEAARAATEVERTMGFIEISKRDRKVAEFDQSKVLADTEAAISNVKATMAQVCETIDSVNSDIFKLDIDISNVENRVKQRTVRAPCSGRIVRLFKVGAGSTVDAGTVMAVIAPFSQDLAAELFVTDNDAPLISVGRPVRLQFAGWPALQFTGWPSVAVGTFGGRVAVIDQVDNGKHAYRVIVKPDWKAIEAQKDQAWPQAQFLRPGAEATGWIMLDTVPLGFELWRQFNAFPPTIKPEALGLSHETGDGKGSSSSIKSKSK